MARPGGARNYVLCELGWNINADIDALLDDYYAAAYAEAAPDVRRFFHRIEQIHARKPDPLDFCGDSTWGGAPLDQFAHYTSDDLAYLDTQLGAAARTAKEPKAAERLAILARLWGLSRLHVAAYLEADKLQKTTEITSEGQITRLLGAAARGLKLLGEVESYAFDDHQLKALFPAAKDPRARLRGGFQNCHLLRVLIEDAAERVCGLGSAFLEKQPGGAASARAFWLKTAAGVEDAMLPAVSNGAGGWGSGGARTAISPSPAISSTAPRPIRATARPPSSSAPFTAPAGVARCIPLLGAPRGLKMGEGGIWFDDASLVKLHDPSYFKPLPATAKPH